ncbi:MAG: helix-turn-helix domain-containing protein [Pseudomonadota bacterium]
MKPNERSSFTAAIPVFHQLSQGPLDLWVDACSSIYSLSPMDAHKAHTDYSVNAWHVDPLSIFDCTYEGMATRHGNWHIEESGAQIHVHKYSYGRASVETSGIPVECEAGAITLLDYSRPFSALHTPSNCHSFFVPHSAINYRPSDAHHSPVYSPDSTMGRMLEQEMDHLLGALKSGATDIHPADIRRFLGCVEVAVSPQQASSSARLEARESLKRSIMLFIEKNLLFEDLNVNLILQSFGVSRASLYRLFADVDGVRTYISRRRLYHAVTELADAPTQRGKVHEVAQKWGFSSDPNFNRTVKREFGVTPGSLFEMPVPRSNEINEISPVHILMNKLGRHPDPAQQRREPARSAL